MERVVLIAIAMVALAGCGGGGGSSYALEPTVSCLEGKGVSVSTDDDDLDFFAQDAGEGALEADLDRNSVTVVFERSESDAKRTKAAYSLFAGALDAPADDILQQLGNTVIAWTRTPTDDETSLLGDCLSH